MHSEKIQSNIVYPKVKIKDVFIAFWNGIKPQKWKLFAIVFCVISFNTIYIIIPLFYKHFFDVIVIGGNTPEVAKKLFEVIIYVVLIRILGWFFHRIAEFYFIRFK